MRDDLRFGYRASLLPSHSKTVQRILGLPTELQNTLMSQLFTINGFDVPLNQWIEPPLTIGSFANSPALPGRHFQEYTKTDLDAGKSPYSECYESGKTHQVVLNLKGQEQRIDVDPASRQWRPLFDKWFHGLKHGKFKKDEIVSADTLRQLLSKYESRKNTELNAQEYTVDYANARRVLFRSIGLDTIEEHFLSNSLPDTFYDTRVHLFSGCSLDLTMEDIHRTLRPQSNGDIWGCWGVVLKRVNLAIDEEPVGGSVNLAIDEGPVSSDGSVTNDSDWEDDNDA